MKRIAVVVDSTAVIEKEIIKSYKNLYSVPLQIIIGDETFNDGIDLTQDDFFKRMELSRKLPTTSQPVVGELTRLFEAILKEYEHIIYITISSGISGTYHTGQMVRNLVSKDRITVFDSSFTSVLQRQMAIETLNLIDNSEDLATIVHNLELIRGNSTILLVVGDVKHLHRTGRISLAAASIGTVLKIKPVLEFIDGRIRVKQKVRTTKKAHGALLETLKNEGLSNDSIIMLAHANAKDYALKMRKSIREIYPNHQVIINELSPVISVHTGPGTLGVAWIKRNK